MQCGLRFEQERLDAFLCKEKSPIDVGIKRWDIKTQTFNFCLSPFDCYNVDSKHLVDVSFTCQILITQVAFALTLLNP